MARSDVGWGDLSSLERQLLRAMLFADGPVGALVLHRGVDQADSATSQATVSRVLLQLDDAGLTHRVGRQGRVLTAAGRTVSERALADEQRMAALSDAVDLSELPRLGDLLRARRGMECEAAALAASRADAADNAALAAIVRQHEQDLLTGDDVSDSAISFHWTLVRAAHSPILTSLAHTLFGDVVKALEPTLLAVTSQHGTVRRSHTEHVQIAEAIRSGDPVAAQDVVATHMTRLITEVEDLSRDEHRQLSRRLGAPGHETNR